MAEESYIKQLIEKGEGETVEFKKSTAVLREAIQTICAFANKKGGNLIIGVKDDGTILGQQISDDTLKNVANSIKLNTDAKLYPEIEKVEIEGKTLLSIYISESPLKPHLAYGRAFIRTGPTTQQMSRDMYETLLLQRLNGYGFDNKIVEEAGLEEIDQEDFFQFLDKANSIRNLNESLYLPIEVLLEKLELMKNGQLTRAAILLFGKRPGKYFGGHFEVKCGAFADTESYNEFLDDHEFSDNLFSNFKAVLSFLNRNLNATFKKNDAAKNGELELPFLAIREAVVNMIVHKDYRTGIKSTVEIRPDRVVFYNPGHLFQPSISIEKMLKPHPSKPGNKLIAKIFYLAGLFENWGSGTLTILSEMKKAGKKSPEFSFDGGMFRLELPRN